MYWNKKTLWPFPKWQILDASKLKKEKFADDNFKFDENSGKFSKRVENTAEIGEYLLARNIYFSRSVFKRLVL